MSNKYDKIEDRRARAWIRKKQREGVDKRVLLNTVGMFSNKKKETVMKQKGLTEQQYRKRWSFLSCVYSILFDET